MTEPNDPAFVADGAFGSGLTKREYFAALAMQANRQAYPRESSDQIARNAIADAYALIANLNKVAA